MTELGETAFARITERLTATEKGVQAGPMMSAPGLKFGDKIFAFQAKEGMGFRLGPDFDPVGSGLEHWQPLNPFKTKGPLKGWFVVDENGIDQWPALAERALAFTRTL
jgi:hypothetical protein